MPFIWNNTPNPPSTDLPIPVPPGEITYEQREVANLVNAGGTLSYNTPNIGFDILYELPTANVNVAYFTNASFNNITVNTANITTATIDVANINTANITNANILYGFVGEDPTSNLGIASKHYVDAAAANVPSGGSDLQNIIDAKGDLLVGTGFHTATRLPIGSNDQILISDSTSNTGLKWITIAGQESFYNLWIQTHYDLSGNDHQVILRSASEIVMNDGTRTMGWFNKIADIEVSGPGGLDVGVEQLSYWYEVHAIRKSSNGESNLLLHRAPRTVLDQSLITTSDVGVPARKSSGSTATKVSQSFLPGSGGALTSVELEISKIGSPTGLIWLTLESDVGGFPSGTILATTRVMDVARLPTDKGRMRFLFDTNTNVTLSTTYHIVYQGDYTVSDTNYTTIWGLAANNYASGYASEFRGSSWALSSSYLNAEDLWFKTFVQDSPAAAVVMPSGYDQRCLLSYVYNDSNGKFRNYYQKNRSMVMSTSIDWRCFTSITGLLEAVDLGPFIPPVNCSVFFTSRLPVGGPKRNNPIGGVTCTDLPIGDTATVGQMAANTSASDTATIITFAQYGVIVIEEQVLLCRMQNVDCRLYVTGLQF